VRAGADRKRQNGEGIRGDGVMYTLDRVSRHAVAFEARVARNGRGAPRDHAPALRAQNGTTGRGDGALLIFDETQLTSPGNYSTPNTGVSHRLAAGARPPSIVSFDQHDLATHDEAAMALRAESDGSDRPTIIGARIRYLTPLEQERCQGFPDGWTCLCAAQGVTADCRCPDGPRQRALGNAVAVPVARWLGARIGEVLR